MTWAPLAGATQYQLNYTDTATSATTTITTDATTYTPRTCWSPVTPTGGP